MSQDNSNSVFNLTKEGKLTLIAFVGIIFLILLLLILGFIIFFCLILKIKKRCRNGWRGLKNFDFNLSRPHPTHENNYEIETIQLNPVPTATLRNKPMTKGVGSTTEIRGQVNQVGMPRVSTPLIHTHTPHQGVESKSKPRWISQGTQGQQGQAKGQSGKMMRIDPQALVSLLGTIQSKSRTIQSAPIGRPPQPIPLILVTSSKIQQTSYSDGIQVVVPTINSNELRSQDVHFEEVETIPDQGSGLVGSMFRSQVIPLNVRMRMVNAYFKYKSFPSDTNEFRDAKLDFELLMDIPWGQFVHENLSIEKAQEILNNRHFLMEEVKEFVYEKLRTERGSGDADSAQRILCLYGLPGTGKTSIIPSIGKCLGQKCMKFFMGNPLDLEGDLKGVSKSSVNSRPSQISIMLIESKCMNPLIVFENLDSIQFDEEKTKIFLELFDEKLMDKFLKIQLDLSHVFFLCTVNDPFKIPLVLRNKMKLIQMLDYQVDDKMKIAQNFLIPKLTNKLRLDEKKVKVEFDKDALMKLIQIRCGGQSGVGGLQKEIEKILKKVATQMEKMESESDSGDQDELIKCPEKILITIDNLEEYLQDGSQK